MRYSINDVRTAFSRMASAARWAGIDTSHLAMQEGRSTNGIAFRVYVLEDRQTNRRSEWVYGGCQGYLGMTRGETIKALDVMTRVFNGFAIAAKEGARNG